MFFESLGYRLEASEPPFTWGFQGKMLRTNRISYAHHRVKSGNISPVSPTNSTHSNWKHQQPKQVFISTHG